MAVAGMDSKANSLRPFTLELPMSELPEAIASRLPKRLAAAAVVAVTIEATQNETEKLEPLRRDLQQGIDDLDAGRSSDAEAVFVRLKERFGVG